jgi:enoyl-CoA hydratase/carnithine racemase
MCRGGRTVLAIHRCSKPTITAVNGAAVGVGVTMILPSVIRLAYAKAKVGFVFGQRGLVMEACSSFFLPRLIGHSKALYLTTTGAVYTADSPHFGDLFNEILPTPEATLARAHELAQQIVANTSIVSNKVMRDLMYRGPSSAEETHLLDSKMIHGLYGKKDNLEGIESFLEKRPPKFSGNVPADAPGTCSVSSITM